jgi:hypothetical protein
MGIEDKVGGRVKRAAADLLGRKPNRRAALYQEARRLGIRGRSKMSDDELATEIAARK